MVILCCAVSSLERVRFIQNYDRVLNLALYRGAPRRSLAVCMYSPTVRLQSLQATNERLVLGLSTIGNICETGSRALTAGGNSKMESARGS